MCIRDRTQAGANLDDWNAEVPAGEAVPDQEADVAVVGGGGAGLAAAIAAGQQGAKVVVIEKNAEVGGDTLVCEMCIRDSPLTGRTSFTSCSACYL